MDLSELFLWDGTPRTLSPKETVLSAAEKIAGSPFPGLPVLEESGRIVGFLRERDIVRRCVAQKKDCEKVTVAEIMHRVSKSAEAPLLPLLRAAREAEFGAEDGEAPIYAGVAIPARPLASAQTEPLI